MSYFTEMNMLVPEGLYEEWLEIKVTNNLDNGQVSVTNVPQHEQDPYYGTGSLVYDWDNRVDHPDGSRTIPKFENPLRERDFTSITNMFRGTGFERAVAIAKAQFGTIGRGRIMTLPPGKCLSWHYDTEPRLHLPLKTNDKCYMVIEDEVKHLADGRWWHTDTLKNHTAFNGSNEVRTHLVFCLDQGV